MTRKLNDKELAQLERLRPERTAGWDWYTVPEAVDRGLAPLAAIRAWCTNDKTPPASVVLVDVGTKSSSRWVLGFAPRHVDTIEGRLARLEALVAGLMQEAS